ncbi:MAG: hypothetical protein ACXWUM_06845 [Burkholderiaceae bacterium]
MADITVTYLMTFCIAMILLAMAVTAYEFRRMSSLQSRRNSLSLQTALEAVPARLQTRGTR